MEAAEGARRRNFRSLPGRAPLLGSRGFWTYYFPVHKPFFVLRKQSRALADYMLSLRPRLKLHIALHTYSQIVIHRWDYRKKKYKDYNKIKKVLKPVAKRCYFYKKIA